MVVEVSEVNPGSGTTKASIKLYIQFADSTGEVFSVGKIVVTNNLIVDKIIELNNG